MSHNDSPSTPPTSSRLSEATATIIRQADAAIRKWDGEAESWLQEELRLTNTRSWSAIPRLTRFPLDIDSTVAKTFVARVNHKILDQMGEDAQACLLQILMEDYSINAKVYSFTIGDTSSFVNMTNDSPCPICRCIHGKSWSLSNGDKYRRTTLVICQKTHEKRVIMHRLPFA